MGGVDCLFGWTLGGPDSYYIGGLPTKILVTDIIGIISGAVLLSIVAATYPAIQASRVSPVTALEGLHV